MCATTTVLALASPALAAPNMELTRLPISSELTTTLAAQGLTQEAIEDFLSTLAEIEVFDEHTNPTDERRNDASVPKLYWTAPFFTPSPTRGVVGAEQFAHSALTVLSGIDTLMNTFTFELGELLRDQLYATELQVRRTSIQTALAQIGISDAQVQALTGMFEAISTELAAVNARIESLKQEAAAGAAELPPSLLKQVVQRVVLQYGRLGVTPKPEERTLLYSDNSDEVTQGLNMLRARAGTAQLGLRQVILESGYTKKQRDVLIKYFQLRPDVTLRSLAVDKVIVRSTGQTLFNEEGKFEMLDSAVHIRGVNVGSRGACGNTRTCNVVIEYTDVGSRTVIDLTQPGASITPILMPLTFSAHVRVAEPDFVGSIHCNFTTGWSAQGRADVRDGAIVYDGDFSDQIRYSSIDEGGCDITLQEGSMESAYYHTLMTLDDYYRSLRMRRAQDAKVAKDAYEAQIRGELERHRANSQRRRRGGLFGDLFGFIGGPFGSVVGFIIGEARGMYWHTTSLNTASLDPVNFHHSYNIRNASKLRDYKFDAHAIVCYTSGEGGGINGVMRACPDEVIDETDTETGAGEEACPPNLSLEFCIP